MPAQVSSTSLDHGCRAAMHVKKLGGCGSSVIRVSDHARHVMSSSPVPLKNRRVEQRSTLNQSRAETSSQWCGVVVRRGGASAGVIHATCPWFKIT
ncbi:uncharacterized protein TNCV_3861581 [Trichonephila clavipes]|nr:uncharacterized protein TNCV_3861581 [Trichonephila clavipes]